MAGLTYIISLMLAQGIGQMILRNILETSKNTTNVINFNKKNTADLWPLNLFIKDIRNLVASNMSLDKIGKLFNNSYFLLKYSIIMIFKYFKLKNM